MKKKISLANLSGLTQNERGLSEGEIIRQKELFGLNEIVDVAGNPRLELIRDTLKDPMIWFLLIIGLVFVVVGETHEALVLFAAVLPLMFMDVILHSRISASTDALKIRLQVKAKVVRNGNEIIIDVKDIVPGDLLVVSSGDYIPADGIFVRAARLQVDESILTGESMAVHKHSDSTNLNFTDKTESIFVEPACLGFAGTRVLTGEGCLRVLLTGRQTNYGETIQAVANLPQERTPLQKSILKLVQVLTLAAFALCILLAMVRIYQGYGWLDALLSAATLAIAAFPEEFPVVFTFYLGIGIYRLAKRQAFVRRAVSVENIGRITQICTDKTGTITLGELKLIHNDPAYGQSDVDVLFAAVNASDPSGSDPIDQAISEAAQNKSVNALLRIEVFPFTEERRREAAFAITSDGRSLCYMKGSPEIILAKSDLNQQERELWLKKTEQWASKGYKVLACSSRVLSEYELSQKLEPESNFKFTGLMAFADPARPEVAGAIRYCYQNAIGVLMITGDHPETAVAIAKNIGLGKESPNIISAEENPEKLTEFFLAANAGFLKNLDIVARCSPMQKLEIIKAFQAAGELVAVTGDGVNDVPALRAADVAIAMGERGSRSAKEVSSIILANDNFATIVNAIIEGRQLFMNLKASFQYLLLIHIPFVLTAALIPLTGQPLLYLPVHIVWLELIIHPTALFAFQKAATQQEPGKQIQKEKNKIRTNKASFFSPAEAFYILLTGVMSAMVITYQFVLAQGENADINYARAKALLTLILFSAGLVVISAGIKKRGPVIIVAATVFSGLLLTQISFFSTALHIAPLQFSDWLESLILVAGVLVLFKIGYRYAQKA